MQSFIQPLFNRRKNLFRITPYTAKDFKIIKKDIEGNHLKLRTSRLDSNNLLWSTYLENIEDKHLGDYTFLTSADMEEIVEKMFNKKISPVCSF